MRPDTLELLRCPYCNGRLGVSTGQYHRYEDGSLVEGILGCHCCAFPVVAGIPVMHLLPSAAAALAHIEAARPDLALLALFDLERDSPAAAQLLQLSSSPSASYRAIVEALGNDFEGGYFLYRFSDPTFVLADAIVRGVSGAVLGDGGRAIDLCGGSGHLTRSMAAPDGTPAVLADLYFSKLWLARRFTAPACEAVACDGNSPLPFARGAFRLAVCSDAFMYIWTKRQLVQEMLRLTDVGDSRTAAIISHTHNQLVWSPSHGQALPPAGYRNLFETIEPRLFSEQLLLRDAVDRRVVDLSRAHSQEAVDGDAALTLVASRWPAVFAPHAIDPHGPPRGEYRLNPLYESVADRENIRLQLRFPSADYADEYGACRLYLPEEVTVAASTLAKLPAREAAGPLLELVRQRVVLDLPVGWT